MVLGTRKQLMAWMEHGLQISLKSYALSMEDKMAAGAFGRATNYGNYNRCIECGVGLE